MNYITVEMANELYGLGFSFRFRQEDPNRSMTFFKNGVYFQLGGNNSEKLSEEDLESIKDATWIPDQSDLEQWLAWNNFSFSFHYCPPEVCVECVDNQTGTRYISSMRPISYGFWNVIRKILKKKERLFDQVSAEQMQVYRIEMGQGTVNAKKEGVRP